MTRENWPVGSEAQRTEVLTLLEQTVTDANLVAFVRLVAVRTEAAGSWKATFGRVDICRREDATLGPRYRYKSVAAVAECFSVADFLRSFRRALDEKVPLCVDGLGIELAAGNAGWTGEVHDSDSAYARWPCVHVSASTAGQALPRGPFASAESYPYFGELPELIAAVAEFQDFHGWRDARQNVLHLFFWRYIGRIVGISFGEGNNVVVEADGRDLQDLVVVGRIVFADGSQQIRERAAARLLLTASGEPQGVELALVKAEDIVDWRRLEIGAAPPPLDQHAGSVDDFLRRLIRLGECAGVEFKPFVRLDSADSKWEEILRTALAMSNSRGGYIFIGVDDRGVPAFGPDSFKVLGLNVGALQRAEIEQRQSELVRSALSYGARLRDRIQQTSTKSLVMARRVLWFDGGPVLAIHVKQGDEPPYMDNRDNSVWFRTSATNRRPDETELEEIFGAAKQDGRP